MYSIFIQFIQNSYRPRQKHKISTVYEKFHSLWAVILGGLSPELVSSSPVEYRKVPSPGLQLNWHQTKTEATESADTDLRRGDISSGVVEGLTAVV